MTEIYSFGEWIKQRRSHLRFTQRAIAEQTPCLTDTTNDENSFIAEVQRWRRERRVPLVDSGLLSVLRGVSASLR